MGGSNLFKQTTRASRGSINYLNVLRSTPATRTPGTRPDKTQKKPPSQRLAAPNLNHLPPISVLRTRRFPLSQLRISTLPSLLLNLPCDNDMKPPDDSSHALCVLTYPSLTRPDSSGCDDVIQGFFSLLIWKWIPKSFRSITILYDLLLVHITFLSPPSSAFHPSHKVGKSANITL